MLESRLLLLNPEPVFEDRAFGLLWAIDGLEVQVVRAVPDAIALLMEEHFDGVVVENEATHAIDAATVVRQHFPSLKILCIGWSKAEPRLKSAAEQQQIALADVAARRRQLRAEVRRFVTTLEGESPAAAEGVDPCHSLIGNLNQFPAAEILQMACLGQRTGRFTFKSSRGQSEVFLHHGAIRHAMYGAMEGEPAMAEIFRWRQGRFYFEEGIISQAKTVDRPWAHLLIDNLQKLDETMEAASAVPLR